MQRPHWEHSIGSNFHRQNLGKRAIKSSVSKDIAFHLGQRILAERPIIVRTRCIVIAVGQPLIGMRAGVGVLPACRLTCWHHSFHLRVIVGRSATNGWNVTLVNSHISSLWFLVPTSLFHFIPNLCSLSRPRFWRCRSSIKQKPFPWRRSTPWWETQSKWSHRTLMKVTCRHPSEAFLKPVSTATCQGMFATCVMFAGAMCALTNGAMVRLWTQKASPLALLIFHVAPAQRGKSRLYQATELLFEVADDVLQSMAKDYARTQQTENAAEVDVPVQTKSISIQSCTPTELFFRSSCDFPQVQASEW